MTKSLELLRLVIPSSCLIGDNSAGHYKQHMKKLQYFSSKTRKAIAGDIELPGGFIIPDKNLVPKDKNDMFNLRYEIWKYGNREFDLQNYAKSYKAPIDVFTNLGYWKDDNFNFVKGVFITGGSSQYWRDRAFRCEDDGLPEELNKDWWIKNSTGGKPSSDVFLRIIVSD